MKDVSQLSVVDFTKHQLLKRNIADIQRRLTLAQENYDVHIKTPERTNLIASFDGQIYVLSDILASYQAELFYLIAEDDDYVSNK